MQFQDYAPIALFAYRRTDHLSRTLDALEACPEFKQSRLFIFSDGPKSEAAAADVAAVRRLLRERAGENMTIVEAPQNKGLAASIIGGVTRLCDEYGSVIVLEDDLLLTPQGLTWLNASLQHYVDDPSVFQISAYQWWNPLFRNRRHAVFGRQAVSWGWATWKRAWDKFDPAVTGWESLQQDKALRRAFDMDGSYPLSEMLMLQINGKIDSWAIRWAWTVFREGGLVLYPPRSLVSNIGFDETGTHTSIGRLKRFAAPPTPLPWKGPGLPEFPEPRLDPVDERRFHRGLRASGAYRNRRIVAVLRWLGLWNKN